MSNMKLDARTISLDDIGRAYIADHEAQQELIKVNRRFDAGRASVETLQAAQTTADAARKHRNMLTLHFAAGAHCNVVTLYGDAA